MTNTKIKKKLTLQRVHISWFTSFAIRLSFYFEKTHGNRFKKYKMQLSEWVDNVNKNLEVKILMIVFTIFEHYEICFDFSFDLFMHHSYIEIEDLFLKLFSEINSVSEIEKPFEVIDGFVDNILLEEKLFMECVDSAIFIRDTTNIHEIGEKLYEMIKANFHILFDDNDMKLYLQEKLGL